MDWVAQLVGEHRIRLLAQARGQGLPPDQAFDCVQEAFQTFLRLPQARRLADQPEDSARLLTTVLRNAARTLRRRDATTRRRQHPSASVDELADPTAAADEALLGAQARRSLERCVSGLNEMQRAVVTLRMLDELSGEEVAGALGISARHVAVLLHRAKASLRGCMSAAGFRADGCASGDPED